MTLQTFLITMYIFGEPYSNKSMLMCSKYIEKYIFRNYNEICDIEIRAGGLGDFYGTFFVLYTKNERVIELMKKKGNRVCRLNPK